MSDIAGSINCLVLQDISSPNTVADLAHATLADASAGSSVAINSPISHTSSHTSPSPLPAQLASHRASKKDHHQHTTQALKILSNVESRIQQCCCLLLDSSNGTFTTISEDLAKLRKAVENVRHQSDLVLSKKRMITNSLDELEIELRSARQSDGDHHTPVEFVVGVFHCSVVCESMLTSLVVNQDQSPIHRMDIVTQVAMLICVVCHVMFGVDTLSGNFIMGAISLLLYLAFQTSKGTPSLSQENILQQIPLTIQTALSRFQLGCKTVIYAVCSCHCTYTPTYAQGSTIPKYPEFCTHRPTPEFKCGEPLLDTNACGDSQPKKVFAYHEFNDYLANLCTLQG